MKTPRSNNSITIAFGTLQRYRELIKDSQLFINYILLFIKLINFELIHRPGCSGARLTRFVLYTRKRNDNLPIWRVQCTCCKKTWSVLPEFTLRYTGLRPEQIQPCLYNLYYGGSLAVNENLFKVPAMQQYNYLCAIGRNNLPTMLLNCGLKAPNFVILDEKHERCQGHTVYLPTITSGRCVWHLGYCSDLEEPSLSQSYGEFKKSVCAEYVDYEPEGVLTDGFVSTQKSAKKVFPDAQIGICLLHASLLLGRKIKKVVSKESEKLSKRFFNIINGFNPKELLGVFKIGQRIRRFKELLQKTSTVATEKITPIINWINDKKAGWMKTMQITHMPKTTTILDQAHNMIDRKLFMMKKFHHTNGRQKQFINGFALLYNLIPYQKRANNKGKCAIQVDGGCLPASNWMMNIQVLTSAGYKMVRNNTT